MTKAEQMNINEKVLEAMKLMEYETPELSGGKRLRSCSAKVYDTPYWYVLQSYRTIIACIDKRTDTCYDFLRYVYGYTSTSGQHVAKFRKDYGSGKWGCEHEYTWRDC